MAPLLEEHERIERAGKLHWFHWLIVGASLILTLSAWYFVQAQGDERISNQFNRESDQVVELISERMRKYEDALWGGVAAIHARDDRISYQEWKRFSKTLQIEKKYPGINGIGVIHHVLPEDVAAHLAEHRASRPGFRIHPRHNRNELFPITFIEPVDINSAAVGLDIAHEINRYTAAKKAQDTGKAQITGPIILVQDKERTPGFLFYAPYYEGGFYNTAKERRKHFIGMVYAPFIFKKLMEGTLEKEKRRVGIRIMDGGDVLYDENRVSEKDYDSDPLFRKTAEVQMFGRTWNFEILSTLSFRQTTGDNKPWMILAGGIVIDSLLFGLFIFLARSNRRAIQFADKMTREYQSKTSWLSNVIEYAVDGLITIDENGLIESFNPACEEIFGYKAKNVMGQNIKILMPEPNHSEQDRYPNNFHDTGEKQITGIGREVQGRKQDGTVFPLELSVSEISIEGRRLYSGIVRDITERKRAEDEILRSNIELERFAYIASHDLQEPLRMVSTFTDLLREDYSDKLDDQARQYMSFTTDASKRMRALVLDLLEYSRVGAEESGFSEFDGEAQLEAVLENLKEAVDETGAEITIDAMPTIFANPVRFSRLMQNLIGNGIKYRAPDRTTQIHVSAEERENDWLFAVRDNGIGIRQEYFEQIFVIFKRLHNKNEYTGTGIGLAICKKIVANFGGRLWVESDVGKGSVFYFTVPKQRKLKSAA
ncbi:MAG: PAS domain S-box protein [Rhodospirillaceae bacterium]|nr:PAS domain S-box protein [Rhodospirillaceae bacterium]